MYKLLLTKVLVDHTTDYLTHKVKKLLAASKMSEQLRKDANKSECMRIHVKAPRTRQRVRKLPKLSENF